MSSEVNPESLGTGVGSLLADLIPFSPSGMRRAGAAEVMAARTGQKTSFMLRHPLASQVGAVGVGALPALIGEATPTTAGLAMLPLLLLQAAKRSEIMDIQQNYDARHHLRLADTPGLQGLLRDSYGSERLGATQAYASMKNRKYTELSTTSEMGDVVNLLGNATATTPISTPLTQMIDNAEAARITRALHKAANNKDKNYVAHQRNAPTIPAVLLAAAGTALGLTAAATGMQSQLAHGTPLPRKEWQGIVNAVSGGNPRVLSIPGLNNAYFSRPDNEEAIGSLVSDAPSDQYDVTHHLADVLTGKYKSNLTNQIREQGVVLADPAFAQAAVLAHEGGHGQIENTPGILRDMQRHLYPYASTIAPIAGLGSLAVGLKLGSTLAGAAAGTGIGLLSTLGQTLPEAAASYKGMRGLESYEGGKYDTTDNKLQLLAALSTYAAANILPSTLAGAAGGWIGGQRKKHQEAAEAAGGPVTATTSAEGI